MLHQFKAHPRQGGDKLLQLRVLAQRQQGWAIHVDRGQNIVLFEKGLFRFQHAQLLFQHVQALAHGDFGKIAVRRDTL